MCKRSNSRKEGGEEKLKIGKGRVGGSVMVSRVLIMEEEEPKSERKAWRKDNG